MKAWFMCKRKGLGVQGSVSDSKAKAAAIAAAEPAAAAANNGDVGM